MPKKRKNYCGVSEIGPSPPKVDADADDDDDDADDDGQVGIWRAPLPGGTAELKTSILKVADMYEYQVVLFMHDYKTHNLPISFNKMYKFNYEVQAIYPTRQTE